MLGIQVVRDERGEERVVSEFAVPEDYPISKVLEVLELEHGDDIETIVSLLERDKWGDEDPSPDPQFDVPDEGEVVRDMDTESWAEDERVYVTEVTDIPAHQYELEPDTLGELFEVKTVADRNLSFDPNAPVVFGRYVSGSDKEYAFPADRLERFEP